MTPRKLIWHGQCIVALTSARLKAEAADAASYAAVRPPLGPHAERPLSPAEPVDRPWIEAVCASVQEACVPSVSPGALIGWRCEPRLTAGHYY